MPGRYFLIPTKYSLPFLLIIILLVTIPKSRGMIMYIRRMETSWIMFIVANIPPFMYIKIGERIGMSRRPTTAITRASATLASAMPLHPISILEHGMAPTRTRARARSSYPHNILLERRNAVKEATK